MPDDSFAPLPGERITIIYGPMPDDADSREGYIVTLDCVSFSVVQSFPLHVEAVAIAHVWSLKNGIPVFDETEAGE